MPALLSKALPRLLVQLLLVLAVVSLVGCLRSTRNNRGGDDDDNDSAANDDDATDDDDTIYLAPGGGQGSLYTVDPTSGVATPLVVLQGSTASINSLAFHEGELYGVVTGSAEGGNMQLVQISTTSGTITDIGSLPGAVDSLVSSSP